VRRATRAVSTDRWRRVRDFIGLPVLEARRFVKPHTTLEGLGALKSSFADLGALGFDAVAQRKYPQVERINHVQPPATRRHRSMVRRWC